MVAAIGAAATVASAVITSSAASDAADAQRNASSASIGSRNANFDQMKALLQPWIDTGVSANAGQRDLVGLGTPDAQQAAIDRLKGGPEFGSLKRVGEDTILANASATGGIRGGNVNASLSQFDQGLLSKLINDQYTRLGGLSGQGLTATSQVAGIGANVATGNSADINNAGAAEAGGILGVGKGILGGINGLTNAAGVFMGGGTPTTVATTPTGVPMTGGFGGGPVFS